MSGATEPAVTDPGVTDPDMTDPGVTDPDVADPPATGSAVAGAPSNTDSRRWSELLDTLGQGEPAHDAPAADACAEAIGQMFLFLDRELDDPAARHRIATHLEICVDCVATYDTEKLVRAVLLRSCSGERAPVELRSRIAELIAATDRSATRE